MTPEVTEKVAAAVTRIGLADGETTLAQLRSEFPGLRFAWCWDDDVGSGKPVWDSDLFALYLYESGDHCLGLTTDYASAGGFLVAEKVEE
ncbi:MAG: hypothetical protein COX57_04610 [Alphaproteobacteria bacterium CG_4_10_14_0_2_um_filter_63_37]|nr:MAG: hypothetical protein AUJ55_13130 [Proteobacteria bacterium CG1_02_64_396]PJA25180.1 MAG: hypothetical protein COX57_04610 [Alphaproteobacteria bacterium CG_4_10_14_0_2_um_filter_63_37]